MSPPVRARSVVGWCQRNGLFFGLVALVAFFTAKSDRFLTVGNVRVILLNMAIVGLVAVPAAMLVLSGYVDLSVGSMGVLAAVAFAEVYNLGAPVLVAGLCALGVGALWGALAGWGIAYLGLSPIVVTLGGLAALRGLAQWLSDAVVTYGFGDTVSWFGNGRVLSIPVPVLLFAGAYLIGVYVWYVTPAGRHMTAIGEDAEAARAVGINRRWLPMKLYIVSGVAGATGGLILMAQLDASSMSIGQGLELDVLTAVLLGGVSFVGGRGSLFGVLVGALFIGVLQNGLLLINVSAYLKSVAVGAALVAAAGLDVLYRKLDRVIIEHEPSQPPGDDALPLSIESELAR
jgi:ribose transport system permease protein